MEEVAVEQEEKVKEPGFFQKLFFWFIVPVLFLLAILLIIAYFTNTNVFSVVDGVKEKIPFLSSEKEVVENSAITESKIVELQASLKEKEAEVEKLQTEIEGSNSEKETLMAEKEELTLEIQRLQQEKDVATKAFSENVAIFESMSAKSAAATLTEMDDEQAMKIITQLKPATVTAIFEKMAPADSAKYTQLLLKD